MEAGVVRAATGPFTATGRPLEPPRYISPMSLKHNLSRRLRIGGKFGERVLFFLDFDEMVENGGFVATVCPFKRRKIRYAQRLSQFLDSYRSPIFQPIFRFSIPIRDTSVSINFINTFRENKRHV